MNQTIEMISPQQAHEDMEPPRDALLVCAYETEEKFQNTHLGGAIPLGHFEQQAENLPRDREIIFYCACPHEEAARAKAAEYHGRGFRNVRVLAGGVSAWKDAGYPLPPEQPVARREEEWGERIGMGKAIARGGKTHGPVPGATEQRPESRNR